MWHPNDDGLVSAKIRLILCFTPFLPHELPKMPPLLDVKSMGVKIPALFDSPKTRLLNLNLVPFQLHLDRDFLYPEETVSGFLTFSARNGPIFLFKAPEISISGAETVHMVRRTMAGEVFPFHRRSLFSSSRSCPLPGGSKEVPAGASFAWKFTFKLPPLIPPSFELVNKESIAYAVKASIVLEPGGEANTWEVEAPFRIGGPLPPALQSEKPKTHSFHFIKDDAVGVKMISGSQEPPALNGKSAPFAAVHISLPPGGCLAIGQENSLSIRIDSGEEPPAPPAPPAADPSDGDSEDATVATSVASAVLAAAAEATPPSSPILGALRLSGSGSSSNSNIKKATEFRITKYKLRSRGHMRLPNSVVIYPLHGGVQGEGKFLSEIESLAKFDEKHSAEIVSGDISDIAVPLRSGNNQEFVTVVNLSKDLHPSISSDQCELYYAQWNLHVEIKFGSHSPEAVMPVLLCVPAPPQMRPATAYRQGLRILDIAFVPNTISIPVAYPAASGERWKVLSGTFWSLVPPAAATPALAGQDILVDTLL